jgi:hypothetical protein
MVHAGLVSHGVPPQDIQRGTTTEKQGIRRGHLYLLGAYAIDRC